MHTMHTTVMFCGCYKYLVTQGLVTQEDSSKCCKIIPWKSTHTLTNKQVEHDVGYDDIERAEVYQSAGVVATVRLPVSKFIWRAERRLHLRTEETRKNKRFSWNVTVKSHFS